MNYEINCQFSNPKTFDGSTPTSTDFWNYENVICQGTSTPATIELIENASTGASFYVSKTIGYGDILIITFLLLFLVFGILKFLTDFLVPKLINFKRK
ncbi:unnamed protein product [marine sediment metagenome]|uniref:Uncharacterized protein n=1 Tax=marine sediment metagenome TaxID=412755 RepID=X1KKR6_9ZZZZ